MAIKVYTRTGDEGYTRIRGGECVAKTDIRIEANGALDELNSVIGVARAFCADGDVDRILGETQRNMMTLMSLVATPSERRMENPRRLPEDVVGTVERWIDEYSARTAMKGEFVLPSGNPAAAFMHQARTVCRRAERRLWELNGKDPIGDAILKYVNRLSDLFFTFAVYMNASAEMECEVWRKFGSKE